MPRLVEDNLGSPIYKGPYAIMRCPHCEKNLEAGPRLLAKWAFCVLCQKPIHNKWPCHSKCPKWHGGWDKWDASSYKYWVMDMIEGDVDSGLADREN